MMNSNVDFSLVTIEEDVLAMLQMFSAGYYPINYGSVVAVFDYTGREKVNDDAIYHYHHTAPTGTTKYVPVKKVVQSKRMLSDNKTILRIVKSPDEIPRNTIESFLDL